MLFQIRPMMTVDSTFTRAMGRMSTRPSNNSTHADFVVQRMSSLFLDRVTSVFSTCSFTFRTLAIATLALFGFGSIIMSLSRCTPSICFFPCAFQLPNLFWIGFSMALYPRFRAGFARAKQTIAVCFVGVELGQIFGLITHFANFGHTGGFSIPPETCQSGGF